MLASVLDYQVQDLWINYVFIEWINPEDSASIAQFKAAVN